MSAIEPLKTAHPLGEQVGDPEHFPAPHRVQTLGGPVEGMRKTNCADREFETRTGDACVTLSICSDMTP